MATQPQPFITPEQYLEIERKAEYKSEYYNGEMFAMSGATRVHNLLSMNAARELSVQLRRKTCEVYANEMRVRVSDTGNYAYPDIVAVCGQPRFLDGVLDTLLNPTLLIEVLSPSTEAYDRGRKFEQYRSIDSLQQYLMLSPNTASAELFTRQKNGKWEFEAVNGLDQIVTLESVGCQLAMADLYEKIEIPPK